MALAPVTPETIFLEPTPHVPNSKLPIIMYRQVLLDPCAAKVADRIEPNKWIKGGQWSRVIDTHFHSVTHECYSIIHGSATYVLGKSPIDGDDVKPYELYVTAGDVFILPAGIAHTSKDHKDSYEYVGLYPEGGPIIDGKRWDMNWCKESEQKTKEVAARAAAVPIPDHDPLYGLDGPLPKIWRNALA